MKVRDSGGFKTGKTLPTGHAADTLETEYESLRASIVDITIQGFLLQELRLGGIRPGLGKSSMRALR